MSTTSSPAPLAGPIAPPAIVVPATAAPVAASQNSSPAPTPAAAPTPPPAEAGSVYGDLSAPASQADDEILNYAVAMGLGGDLGLSAPAPAAGTATAQPTAEPTPAAVPAAPADETPAQKLARLETEAAALRKTLAPEGEPAPVVAIPSGQATAPAPVFTPTPENPLVNLRTAEHFDLTQRAATQLQEWAITHRADGGALPLPLAQLVENAEAARTGRTPATLTAAPIIDPDSVGAIELATSQMLNTHLPKRREVLGTQSNLLGLIRRETPQFLDPSKEEGKLFQAAAAQYPQLAGLPEWPMLARDLITGYLANRAKTAAPAAVPVSAPAAPALTVLPPPTVQTASGQTVPLAPSAPIGGLMVGGQPVSQKRLTDAEARLNAGTASDEDLTLLSAAAV